MAEISSSVFYGQIAGFLIAFTSSVTVTVTTTWNQWSKTSSADSAGLLGPIWGFNGIWIQCIQHSTGQFNCNDYNTAVFNLPVYMNVIRGLMCTAIIFSVLGCFACLIGMQCSRLLETSPDAKRTMMQLAGGFFIGAGVLTTISVSWYSAMVMDDFFSYSNQDNMMRYTLGATLWVGIFSAVFSFAAGIIFFCFPGPKEESSYTYGQTSRVSYARKSFDHRKSLPYNESSKSLRRVDDVEYV